MKRFALLVAVVLAGMDSQASAQAPPPTTLAQWSAKWQDANGFVLVKKDPSLTWYPYEPSKNEARRELWYISTLGGPDAAAAKSALTFFGFARFKARP